MTIEALLLGVFLGYAFGWYAGRHDERVARRRIIVDGGDNAYPT